MKLLVFTLHFCLKRLCRMNNDKNTISQMRDETTNATQGQREFEG